jgi:hypothetical protein
MGKPGVRHSGGEARERMAPATLLATFREDPDRTHHEAQIIAVALHLQGNPIRSIEKTGQL